MTNHNQEYRLAEQAFLHSEGIEAESHSVNLDRLGGTVRVVISGDGPAVLFVPGVMTTGVVFAGLVSQLSDFRCIMIDRPGTGLSPLLPNPPSDLASQRQVADTLLIDIMDGLNIDRSHVVCTSLGGWTTFRGAAAHPDRLMRISGLAWLMGARIHRAPLSMRVPAPKALLPSRVPARRAIVRAMLKSSGMRAAIENGRFSDQMLDYMVALLRHTPTFRNDSLYNPRPIGPRGPVDEVVHSAELLSGVTSPVSLFWGADDLFGGEASASEFTSLLPSAKLQMAGGAGHAPWLDEPDLAVAAVRQHLAGSGE